ncbi:MAG: PorP/SprF family type IX secretion system membrane protein, partial [Bacteroidales bacterium]|nr:PorP/SprF family type IX secretion system membrane protein [Bacteroidales bacterium]
MNYRRVWLTLMVLLFACTCRGQQDPQFSQYMYSDFCINPAIAGSAGICATTLFRQQWAGFSESYMDENGETHTTSVAPQEIVFNLHSPVKFLHGGVGASFYRDQEGHQNNIDVKLAYAYKMNIGGGFLNIGLAFQMSNLTVLGDEYRPVQPGDPVVPTSNQSDFFKDLSFGLYYKDNDDKWYAGLSVTQLLGELMG